MKYPMSPPAGISLSRHVLVSVVILGCYYQASVAMTSGSYYCDGVVTGDQHRKAVKDIVNNMATQTPKSVGLIFEYYENSKQGGVSVSGSSRCDGTVRVPADEQACKDCMARLQTLLTSTACLGSSVASANENSACAMAFWEG